MKDMIESLQGDIGGGQYADAPQSDRAHANHSSPETGPQPGHSKADAPRTVARLQTIPASDDGGQRAIDPTRPRGTSPAGNNPRGTGDGTGQPPHGAQNLAARSDRPASDGGCDDGQQRAARQRQDAIVADNPREGAGDGQRNPDAHIIAAVSDTTPARGRSRAKSWPITTPHAPGCAETPQGEIDGGHGNDAHHSRSAPVDQFADPTIASLKALCSMRARVVAKMTADANAAQSVTRRHVRAIHGIRTLETPPALLKESAAIYKAIMNGTPHPLADPYLTTTILAMVSGTDDLATARKQLDKELARLAKTLPVASFCESIKGFGFGGLAQIVGAAGDLSKYKSVAAVWKRMGLAVIDGGRQRKCTDAGKAAAHAYSPQRRSLMYVIVEALIKCQGTGENAGPYRQIYDREKARQEAMHPELTPAHRHARAMRYMTKALLRDLTIEWRKASPQGGIDGGQAPSASHLSPAPADH